MTAATGTMPELGAFFRHELENKVILVTGASGGIGAAVARAFGACGAKVAVHYGQNRDAAEAVAAAIEREGGEALLVGADLAVSGAGSDALVETVTGHFGGLDILVNNAGDPVGRWTFLEAETTAIERILELNLGSVIRLCRRAVPALKQRGGGAIINTTSIAARTGGGQGMIFYAVAKAGVAALTKGLARELAGDAIRVNAVAPGIIDTPLHGRLSSPAYLRRMVTTIPAGRAGTAEECVGAYLYLASDMLSGYVTGQTIDVNGGQFMA